MLIPSLVQATGEMQSHCGIFKIVGKLSAPKGNHPGLRILVNQDTKNELSFEVPHQGDLSKLVSHMGQLLEFTATIKRPLEQMRGQIFDLKDIRLRNPDPLRDVGLIQISSMKCEPGNSHVQ
jgi:hypothetical protein